jgi:hypothetical protein
MCKSFYTTHYKNRSWLIWWALHLGAKYARGVTGSKYPEGGKPHSPLIEVNVFTSCSLKTVITVSLMVQVAYIAYVVYLINRLVVCLYFMQK